MCYAYSCRKARQSLRMKCSMKLPAELFEGQEKQEQKRQATVFFACLGSGSKPHFGNCSCQSFPQESSDRPYFYDSKV